MTMNICEQTHDLASSLIMYDDLESSLVTKLAYTNALGVLAEEVHKQEAGKLPSYPTINLKHKPDGPENVNMVTSLQNGKTYNNDIKIPSVHGFSHDAEDFVTDDEIVVEESPKFGEGGVSSTTTPYPTAFEKSSSARLAKKGPLSEDMWETFKQVKINLPLIDAIKQILTYTKYLKDFCTQKRKLKATLPKNIDLIEHVSMVISSSLPPKFKDPEAPLILVVVGNIAIKKALLDIGASINILPASLLDNSLDHQRPSWSYKVEPLPANFDTTIKLSLEVPPTLELKPFPSNLKYAFLAVRWTIADLKGISPSLCMHRIVTDPYIKPSRDAQRRLNPNIKKVVKKEVLKWLDDVIIYPISDSKWVIPRKQYLKRLVSSLWKPRVGKNSPTD
nr:hypothetical protein [Tanacetum cinerariifolium]